MGFSARGSFLMARSRTIRVNIVGDASGAQASLGRLNTTMGGLFGSVGRLAGAAGIAGLGVSLIRGGKAAVGMAVSFESSMTKMISLVGISREEIEAWKGEIKDLAGETARAPQELADAMFFITSAGLRGSDAMDALRASAQAAAIGLGDTKDIAFAAVSAMNAYGAENLSAERAVNILMGTVREGNVEAAEVAGVLGRIIPVAAELGLSFDQVGAAVAAMTRLGANAAESVTNLTGIMRAIINPTVQAEKALGEYGLSGASLRRQLKEEGLLSVLGTLSEVFADNEEAATQVFGRIQGLTGFLSLMGSNAEENVGIFARLAEETDLLGEGMEIVSETAEHKFAQALAELQAVAIDIGEKFLPILTDALRDIMPVLLDLLPMIGDFFIELIKIADEAIPLLMFGLQALQLILWPFIKTFEAVNFVLDLFKTSSSEGVDAAELFSRAMLNAHDSADAAARTLAILAVDGGLTAEAITALAEASGFTEDEIRGMRDEAIKLIPAIGGTADAVDVLNESLGTGAQNFDRSGGRARAAALGMGEFKVATEDTTGALEEQEPAIEDVAEETRTLIQRLDDARRAQESLSEVLLAAANPVFNAVRSFQNYQQALEAYDEELNKANPNSQLLAELQLEIAKEALGAQVALDELSGDSLEEALDSIAQALGITKGEAANLLEELGILDGKKVVATVEVKAPVIHYRTLPTGEVVPSQGGMRHFAKGGIATGPMLGLIGEGGDDEAVIPLNTRGITVLAAALREALGMDDNERPAPQTRPSGGVFDGATLVFQGTSDEMLEDLARRVGFEIRWAS